MKASKLFPSSLTLGVICTIFLMMSCQTTELAEPIIKEISSNDFAKATTMTNMGKVKYDMDKSKLDSNEELSLFSSMNSRIQKFAIYQLINFKVTRIENVSTNALDITLLKRKINSTNYTRGIHSELILLTGYGKGWSEEFGMSMVTTEMKVIPGKLEVSGTITCEFPPSGSTMVFELNGSGPLQTINEFDGPHSGLILKTALVKGTGDFENFKMEGVTYFLSASELMNPDLKEFNSYLMTVGEMMK